MTEPVITIMSPVDKPCAGEQVNTDVPVLTEVTVAVAVVGLPYIDMVSPVLKNDVKFVSTPETLVDETSTLTVPPPITSPVILSVVSFCVPTPIPVNAIVTLLITALSYVVASLIQLRLDLTT